ncbi:C17 cyclopropane fatty acid synthase CfaB [Halopseudomonas pelagia]|uniref:C17 cyclopropane fatty acid synthase CfaB n=1 Tax=Halopseudomonas pelagia TaxID=553151 RepID=UPI0003A326A8|nr:C17 cyclopropane fatty acid synthase CfaB [Halopseudomonas pelagia]|tara:strand:- start:624 stop:1817 length:1194 start_codon:yes stop_codon:yes gene_type:complete
MLRQLYETLSKLKLPLRIMLSGGPTLDLGPEPKVTLEIIDPLLLNDLRQPSLDKLGEAYIDKRMEVRGPIMQVVEIADRLSKGLLGDRSDPVKPRTAHDKAMDAEAIAYHYDLSNDFYALWLDPEMLYSCAYFRDSEHDSLAQAQINKLDHICRKLRLQPGERLLDVGCGWGGLARHAAQHYGVSVYGITLSKEQLVLAREKNAAAGLGEAIELQLQDYRDLPGRENFDKVVSVGMFEHVGQANLDTYFKVLHDQVKPGGLVMNHGITAKHVDGRPVSRGAGTFIGRYVFPHGELPHLSTAIASMSEQGLEVVDVESLRLHYARTLEHWSDNLEARLEEARALVPDKTLRIWRVYLAGCAYGFRKNWINIHQILAVKPFPDGHHNMPWTREDIYFSG